MSGSSNRSSPDTLADGFADIALRILFVDRQGRIKSASSSAESMLVAAPGRLSNLSLDTLISPRNPDWIWHEIRTNASRRGWSGDIVFKRLDGVECWMHVQACRAPAGIPTHGGDFMLIVEDISDRIELTSALVRRSEDLHKRNRELEIVNKVGTLLLDKSDLGSRLHLTVREAAKTIGTDCGLIALKDRSGKLLTCVAVYGSLDVDFVNRQTVALSEKSLMAYTVRTRKPYVAEDLPRDRNAMRNLVLRSSVKSALYVPILAEGRSLGMMLLGTTRTHRTFTTEDVTLAQIIANLAAGAIRSSTISEEYSRAARLASAGELLAGAAHNIGNALMAVRGSLELAKMMGTDCGTSPVVLDRLDQAISHLGNGSDVVLRLMDFARGGKTTPCAVSLRGLAESAIALCGVHPAAIERTAHNMVSRNLPAVEARPGPLQEVLFNLLLNGLQATPPGGEVRIEALELAGEGQVELRVIDNGCGMSPEVLERTFEPFFSTKGGTGLGLSSSAAIVREMGGAVSVDTVPGKGTTLKVRLKIAQAMSDECSQRNAA